MTVEQFEFEALIPASSLQFTFSRSQGPGGQNVNKVSTRVTLHFSLSESRFSDRQKERIKSALRSRIDQEGRIRLISSRHRTQAANRRAALERLHELLAEALRPRKTRRATKISRGAIERRLKEKRKSSEKKLQRRMGRNDF